jgi:hypothetical protein
MLGLLELMGKKISQDPQILKIEGYPSSVFEAMFRTTSPFSGSTAGDAAAASH